ncbi:Hypothetical protein D9617_23g004790 [Elsinoe fawcettii]|nr:Hypothetical protein D9617_23g004790 [Elsinoe fawcettii]
MDPLEIFNPYRVAWRKVQSLRAKLEPGSTDRAVGLELGEERLEGHWRTGASRLTEAAEASASSCSDKTEIERACTTPAFRQGVEVESSILSRHFALMQPDRVGEIYPTWEIWGCEGIVREEEEDGGGGGDEGVGRGWVDHGTGKEDCGIVGGRLML